MANFITLLVIIAAGYWIIMIVSRKRQELADKELKQKEIFLKETQNLLHIDNSDMKPPASTPVSPQTSISTQYSPITSDLMAYATDMLKNEGYSMSTLEGFNGINMIGIREKEVVYVYCAQSTRDVSIEDLKNFIADCVLHSEHQPLFGNRKARRIYMSNRPLNEEASIFIRENSASIEWSAGI
jgi:hypothetical protein